MDSKSFFDLTILSKSNNLNDGLLYCDLENFLTFEYINFVEHPKFGLTINTCKFNLFLNLDILFLDETIVFLKSVPKITSDPIESHRSINSFLFNFIIFFFY